MNSVELQHAVVVGVVVVAVVLVLRFEVFCLTDIARAEQVRLLSKSAWAAVCILSIPIGGILYLMYGRALP